MLACEQMTATPTSVVYLLRRHLQPSLRSSPSYPGLFVAQSSSSASSRLLVVLKLV
jgi:hypothetical protein